MDGGNSDSTTFYLLVSNIIFMLLFSFSEYLGESSSADNGVISLVSRRIFCLGNRRIRINVSLEPIETVANKVAVSK